MNINRYFKIEKRFRKIWWIAGAFIIFLALMDINTMDFWNLAITAKYANVFWIFAGVAVILACLTYYIFKRDKSESVAIGVIFYSLILFGAEDIMFYLIKDGVLPASMPHLFSTPFIGGIAKLLGLSTVTPLSLILSVTIGVLLGLLISNYLIKKL